ncbi:hypothetical protein [Nonomuraea basaltis]|uniref:hypothetical protein n=1 Tax=Nonomuraea basaltis TaxID=2495887 RepID=UPI00110C4841|nr:hypothetical protein [Nonomuraea basaltis]TMS00159.1 hypothetical protein EJK15_03545 [Nonomuraea basaltis]
MKKIPGGGPTESKPLTRAEINRRYRERHKERLCEPERLRVRAYYEANREVLLARAKERYASNPERGRERARRDYQRLRQEMFVAYGDRCACCGESEQEFLCLDHVGGGGNADRARTGGKNSGVLRRLSKEGWPQEGYRVLCANCNTATMRGRVCPHQKESDGDA